MTEKELSQCHWLNIEIGKLQDELRELEGKEYKEINYSGMPHGSGVSDNVGRLAAQRAELHELISLKIKECMIERTRIERFIDTIEDSEMRTIVRLRCIEYLSWGEIAAEMIVLEDDGEVVKEQDRRTITRKFQKYLRNR